MTFIHRLSHLFKKKKSSNMVGLSLGSQSIELCSLNNEVTKQGSLPKIFFDTFQTQPSRYTKLIAELIDKQKLSGECHVILNGAQTQIVQVDKPDLPEEDIHNALKWQIKDQVTISPDNMVLDYFDVPKSNSHTQKINVFCADKLDLQKLVTKLSTNKVEVKSIITEEFAFAKLIPNQEQACLMVCQRPNEEILIIIVKEGKIYLTRRLRGFSKINQLSEAELDNAVIDSLSLEIQRSSDYFERQLKQVAFKEIKVIMASENEGYITRRLAESFAVPVSLLSIEHITPEQRKFASVYGAIKSKCEEESNEKLN